MTVAGHTTLSKRIGDVRFDGQLTPGGSALDIDNGAGSVTIRLPLPTDARASVSAQTTDFHSDAGWLFTPDQAVNPHHWTADLGPNPAGRVTVSGGLGSVDFGIRSTA